MSLRMRSSAGVSGLAVDVALGERLKGWRLLARRWQRRIILAFADQGLYSATNFLLTVLYAAWLPLEPFGRYVIVWTIALFLETIETSLITDNLPAIISRCGRSNQQRLDRASFCIVAIYCAMSSLLLLAAAQAAAIWLPGYGLPLVSLALANPFQRFFLYFRRLAYIRDRQDAAAAGSATYGVTLVAGAFALHSFGILSVTTALLLLGAANAFAIFAICATRFPRSGIPRFRRALIVNAAWLARQMWSSGRWLVGASVGFWIANWGVFPIVAAMAGLETAGVLRALQNIFTPIILFNTALNIVILPRVADKVIGSGRNHARAFAIYGNVAFTGVATIYSAVVIGGAHTILPLLYRKPEIAGHAEYLWPFALAIIFQSARQASSVALLAVGQTRMFFIARLAATIVFVLAAIALSQLMGIAGVLWANVISHAVGTAMMVPEALAVCDPPDEATEAEGGRRQ